MKKWQLVGIWLMLALSIVVFITVIFAFLNGFRIYIAVNNHNEAYLDLILVTIILIWGILTCGSLTKKYRLEV